MKNLLSLALVLALGLMATGAVAESKVISYESRGVQVPATLVTPDGVEEYPVVVMCHGHGGSREENVGFAAVADALAAQGVASIRMDFPGCGESSESFQMNTLTNMEADVLAAIDYVQANLSVSKIGMFGYSMGGRIVLELLANGTPADAVVLLAPAADTADLKELFGGAEAFDMMEADAEENGYVTFITIYGQTQELSKEWFADLQKIENPAEAAATAWNGAALVIWGSDDEAVSPSISESVATALNAQTQDATGEGHGYGFYSEDDTVRTLVASSAADFFAANLK